ncbi:MAG: XdhC family protein [Actinobacteria bacterium]|nr:XdhC family protein [Actinomycetota bacterium]
MREVAADIERWRRRGEDVALATVVATRRSAPRPVGAKLAVSEGGELAGSVSGGCVESDVYEHARRVLRGEAPRLVSYGISDDLAFSVGLPCGGEIDVFVERARTELHERLLAIEDSAGRAVLFTVLSGLAVGEKLLVHESGERYGDALDGVADRASELIRSGRSRVLAEAEGLVFAEVLAPPPRLLVFGAVDTAEALCHSAGQLGWRTIVTDARAKFATAERVPSADEIVVAWPDEALAHVQPDYATAVVVLTHDDRFDVPALAGALRSDAFYVGALGSRRNQARRRQRLLEAGVAEDQLERIRGPAGLDIGGETPAETAISILAEILAARAGRSGGPLRDAPSRIHAGAS